MPFATQGEATVLLGRVAWTLLGTVLCAVALFAMQRPLRGVHWDTPIYLYQANRNAGQALITSYAAHAQEIAGQVRGGRPLPPGEAYPEAYWRFSRLGHIALLGGILSLAGGGEPAINAAVAAYALLMALGVAGSAMMVRALFRLYQTDTVPGWVAPSTALLFALSGAHIYMSGNLVPEVPVFAAIALGMWFVALAVKMNRPAFSLLSGLLAGLSFSMKMDGVWVFLSAWLAMLVAPPLDIGRKQTGAVLTWAACAALIFYAGYAWIFHPLASPELILEFRQRVSLALPPKGALWPVAIVAGGMLWLGLPASLLLGRETRLFRFAWTWFLLCVLPLVHTLTAGEAQTRMFITMVPSLMLISGLGLWSGWRALRGGRAARATTFLLVLAFFGGHAVANPIMYPELRQMPGGWRLQYLRQFLWPPAYEVRTYPLEESHLLADWLYRQSGTLTLLVSSSIAQENLNLVRYFGPPYPMNADISITPDSTNLFYCGDPQRAAGEAITFSRGLADECCKHAANSRVLKLSLAREADHPTLFLSGAFQVSAPCAFQ
jgi:hypothetical protein